MEALETLEAQDQQAPQDQPDHQDQQEAQEMTVLPGMLVLRAMLALQEMLALQAMLVLPATLVLQATLVLPVSLALLAKTAQMETQAVQDQQADPVQWDQLVLRENQEAAVPLVMQELQEKLEIQALLVPQDTDLQEKMATQAPPVQGVKMEQTAKMDNLALRVDLVQLEIQEMMGHQVPKVHQDQLETQDLKEHQALLEIQDNAHHLVVVVVQTTTGVAKLNIKCPHFPSTLPLIFFFSLNADLSYLYFLVYS